MPQAYRTFASYILFREILADELGHVYRAGEFTRSGIQRTVWLRVFDGERVPREELVDRLEVANEVGGILQAANIASKPRLITHQGIPALAFDHVPAQPLSGVFAKVREEGFPVPVDNALLIMEKISLALSAALAVDVEGSSLVHGFLHPGLIVVSTDGEALVSGFGVADRLLSMLDHQELAERIFPYLSPEVLLTRTSSKRSDVYSLGALLFQLLTGSPLPARPEDRVGVLDRAELAYDDQPIPQDIRSLLERALAQRPEERFSSAADFKKELDKLLYGGAYSPTTFNLALFMDRLFRDEVELEERERSQEAEIDVNAYLAPEPKPEPEEVAPEPQPSSGGKGIWIGVAAGFVVAAAVTGYFVTRPAPVTPQAPPTPTEEQRLAQRQAEEQQIRELVDKKLAELLAQKEAEIKAQLTARQGKIDELQKRLRDMEKTQTQGSADAEQTKRDREALQRQLAAEEEAKRKLQEQQAQERQRLQEEAVRRAQAEAAATATAAAEAQAVPTPEPEPTEPPAEPTRVAAVQQPTAQPTLPVRAGASGEGQPETIVENMFVPPTDADTLPAVLKDQPVSWSRLAIASRRRGVVILQATVNADGRVEDVKVLRADDEGFGIPQAASDAVRKYLFKPGTKNDIKIKTNATVTIPYSFRAR